MRATCAVAEVPSPIDAMRTGRAGAPNLLTLRGRDLIASADVVLYAGSLVPAAVVAHTRDDAMVIDSADMTLDELIACMYDAHQAGKNVARVHSGDPSLYGAIGEQIRRLVELGIDYDITPGIPAYAAAALGQELTLHCPVVIAVRASWPDELHRIVKAERIRRTSLILVRQVLASSEHAERKPYDADHFHLLRPKKNASRPTAGSPVTRTGEKTRSLDSESRFNRLSARR